MSKANGKASVVLTVPKTVQTEGPRHEVVKRKRRASVKPRVRAKSKANRKEQGESQILVSAVSDLVSEATSIHGALSHCLDIVDTALGSSTK